MIRADQIPEEVVEAAAISLRGGWGEADEAEKEAYREAARASIAAALNAWPDVVDTSPNNIGHLVLQFKENQDE